MVSNQTPHPHQGASRFVSALQRPWNDREKVDGGNIFLVEGKRRRAKKTRSILLRIADCDQKSSVGFFFNELGETKDGKKTKTFPRHILSCGLATLPPRPSHPTQMRQLTGSVANRGKRRSARGAQQCLGGEDVLWPPVRR